MASAATVLLIGGYSAAVLRGRLRALLMTAVLAVLYGYLYALVMFLTRKIDWGSPRRARPEEVVTPG